LAFRFTTTLGVSYHGQGRWASRVWELGACLHTGTADAPLSLPLLTTWNAPYLLQCWLVTIRRKMRFFFLLFSACLRLFYHCLHKRGGLCGLGGTWGLCAPTRVTAYRTVRHNATGGDTCLPSAVRRAAGRSAVGYLSLVLSADRFPLPPVVTGARLTLWRWLPYPTLRADLTPTAVNEGRELSLPFVCSCSGLGFAR